LVKALQRANLSPPAELAAMAGQFADKVSRGEAQKSCSGFVGKGYTFEADEMNEGQRQAQQQKRQYELEQGIADIDGGFDEEEDEEIIGSSIEVNKEKTSAIATNATNTFPTISSEIDQKAALIRAKLIAQQIATGKKGTEKEGQSEHFADELDINDYPVQVLLFYFVYIIYCFLLFLLFLCYQARRKVTGRNALDDITERTGVAIISRGNFIPAGKKVEPGERRLHLLIEGATEMNVRQAKLEIQRALEEETIKIGLSGQPGSSGRYSVL
jgi:ATP-dependent RNA helicase DDX46/PRP5